MGTFPVALFTSSDFALIVWWKLYWVTWHCIVRLYVYSFWCESTNMFLGRSAKVKRWRQCEPLSLFADVEFCNWIYIQPTLHNTLLFTSWHSLLATFCQTAHAHICRRHNFPFHLPLLFQSFGKTQEIKEIHIFLFSGVWRLSCTAPQQAGPVVLSHTSSEWDHRQIKKQNKLALKAACLAGFHPIERHSPCNPTHTRIAHRPAGIEEEVYWLLRCNADRPLVTHTHTILLLSAQ